MKWKMGVVSLIVSSLLIGCSNEQSVDEQYALLNQSAEMVYETVYELDESLALNLIVEEYHNGVKVDEMILNMGANSLGQGAAQLAIFRLDNPMNELLIIGAIGNNEEVATTKRIVQTPILPWGNLIEEYDVITEKGTYILGVTGFFDEDSMPKTFEMPKELTNEIEQLKHIAVAYVYILKVV